MRHLRLFFLGCLVVLAGMLALGSTANAATIAFTFSSDGTSPFSGTPVDGTVSGLIYDVNLNGNSQQPLNAVITSDPLGLAGAQLLLTTGSIDLTDGVVTGLSLVFGSSKGVLALNESIKNVFANGLQSFAGGSVVANSLGLNGITFSIVPLPATLPLFGTALAALGGLVWWRRRKPAPASSLA